MSCSAMFATFSGLKATPVSVRLNSATNGKQIVSKGRMATSGGRAVVRVEVGLGAGVLPFSCIYSCRALRWVELWIKKCGTFSVRRLERAR